jgi:hypothetical protein
MKVASFKNLLAHYREGSKIVTVETNVNDLLMNEENNFAGWECWAGLQNVTIDNQGNVWRAICRQGGKLGNIYGDFEFPVDTITCQKIKCNCAADIQISKCHPDSKIAIRLGQEVEEKS